MDTEALDVAKEVLENPFFKISCSQRTPHGQNSDNSLMLEVLELMKIDNNRTSSYQPQEIGQVKKHNRDIAGAISKCCSDNPPIFKKLTRDSDCFFEDWSHFFQRNIQ